MIRLTRAYTILMLMLLAAPQGAAQQPEKSIEDFLESIKSTDLPESVKRSIIDDFSSTLDQKKSNAYLLESCKQAISVLDEDTAPTHDPYKVGFCLGFMKSSIEWAKVIPSPAYCLPKGLNARQFMGSFVRVVDSVAEKHPTSLQVDQILLIISILRVAYPCAAE